MYMILKKDREIQKIKLDKICKITKIDESDKGIAFIKVSLVNGEIDTILEYENTNNKLVKHVLDELYCRLSYSMQKDMPLYINEAIEFAEESFKRKQEILNPLEELIMLLEQNKAKDYNFWEKFFNTKSEITQREASEMMKYIGSNLTLAQDKEEILHMLKRVYEEIY